jgi:hypothetical protein
MGRPTCADEKLMRALQDSFDATTRLTLNMKKTGQEIVASDNSSPTITQMMQTGMGLCAELVEPIGKIEQLLMRPMRLVIRSEAVDALKCAAIPFQKLQKFSQEMTMLKKFNDKHSGVDVH